jgi:hypothetical protein
MATDGGIRFFSWITKTSVKSSSATPSSEIGKKCFDKAHLLSILLGYFLSA